MIEALVGGAIAIAGYIVGVWSVDYIHRKRK